MLTNNITDNVLRN